VLAPFTEAEREQLEDQKPKLLDAVAGWLREGIRA